MAVVDVALLPIGGVAGLSGELRWSSASGLFFLSYLPVYISTWRNRHLAAEHSGPISRPITLLLFAEMSLSPLLLLMNVVFLATAWPYILSLGFQLGLALAIFVELLFLSLSNE